MPAPSPPDCIRMLYVDDEPALLEIGKMFLERDGDAIVLTAESAQEAIAILKNKPVDAIISDYQMPGMDGIAFLQHIRQTGDDTPFIIFTGKGREDVVIEALNSGADFYLQKGGDPKSQFAELSNKVGYAVARRRSEIALRRSEERYRSVVTDQTEFICRFLPDGTILFANESYCRYFQIDCERVAGTKFRPSIHPEDRETVHMHLNSLTPDDPSGSLDQRILMPDGSVHWQRWNTTAIFDENGCLSEYQSVGRDITETREAELKLAHSHDLLRYIIEHNNAAVAVHDRNLTYIFVSQRYLDTYGVSEADIIGRHHYDVFLDLPEKWKEIHRRVLAGEGVFSADDDPYPREDGRIEWTRWECRPWFEPDGSIGGLIVYTEIITERKEREEEILRKNEELAAAEEELRSQVDEVIEAKDALQEANEYLNNLITHANAPIIIWNPDCRITRINHAVLELTGMRAEELIEESPGTIFPETMMESSMKLISGTVAGKQLNNAEIQIQQRNGTRRRVIWNSAAIMDSTGERLRSVIAHGVDITDQRKAEEQVKRFQKRESDILNFLPDATFAIDAEGRVITWNRAMEVMTGVPAREMLGKGNYEYAIPIYRERRPLLIDLVLRDDPALRQRYPYVSSDGDKLISEIHIPHLRDGAGASLWFTASPLYNERGEVSGAIESIRDITELKAAEAALRAEEARVRAIAETAQDAVLMMDPSGKVSFWNKAAEGIFGYTQDEVLGSDLHLLLAPDRYHTAYTEGFVRFQRSGEGRVVGKTLELEACCKDGSVIAIELSISAIQLEDGWHAVGIIRDISSRKAAEKALLESESRFRELADMLPQVVYETDLRGNLTYANQKAFEMYGYSQSEFEKGLNVFSTIHPDDLLRAKENFSRQLEGLLPDTIPNEYRGLRKDGMVIPVAIYSSPVYSGDTITGLRGIIIDTTEQKQLQEELRKSRDRFRSLVANIPGVVYRCLPDTDWTMLYLNTDIEDITGYPAGDFINNAARTFKSIIHPDDRDYVDRMVQAAIHEGKPWEIECRLTHRDGSIRWIYENGRAIMEDDGTVLLDGIILDSTERKKATEALRKEQAFTRLLLDTSPAYIVAIADDGTILKVNPALAEALEADWADLTGKSYIETVVPAEEHMMLSAVFQELLSSGKATVNQNHIISRTGQRRLIEWYGRYVRTAADAGMIIGIGIDITERKAIDDALREANKRLNLLSSITRHDILNKIMTIKGYLTLIDSSRVDEETTGHLHQIQQATAFIERQIEFTRQYEQLGAHDPAWLSIGELVSSLDDSTIPITLDCQSVSIYADPMVELVFANLYDNTLRHAAGAGAVQVQCRKMDGDLLITWEDDGPGVPPEQKELIFQSGYGKHTGLGLFLTQEILGITGIVIRETGVFGKGARFEIRVRSGAFSIGNDAQR
ncbi:MAG: PAS domain S-box protein [Methanocalculus sp. MSAO_Arc1]|uniref:PAS domain S-box protein n=1 Tax=Methanocalculus TaxID=71151 RepID=UPI000FEF3852|nr:PAS domain S-box protein [Methanocalculus sp. MSAO_Arc1]RQD80421.1 MAG: PAS domain S-box protein [Methanocalculus sp. MSAO_Arc1]